MSWLRILSLSFAMAAVSCSATSPLFLPAAHEQVIRSEWATSQALLSGIAVKNAGLVPPTVCTWIPHDGMFETSASYTGWANGEFDPNTFTIKWNTQTPTVIRHEAGHAILHFVDHPCASCFSVDSSVTLHPGPRCEGTKIGEYCADYLEAHK